MFMTFIIWITSDQRYSKPKVAKAQPKPATATKKGTKIKGGKATRGRGRGRNLTKRTLEELDTEMVDYFTPANGGADGNMGTNSGAVQPAGANGDAAMEDEIEVIAADGITCEAFIDIRCSELADETTTNRPRSLIAATLQRYDCLPSTSAAVLQWAH